MGVGSRLLCRPTARTNTGNEFGRTRSFAWGVKVNNNRFWLMMSKINRNGLPKRQRLKNHTTWPYSDGMAWRGGGGGGGDDRLRVESVKIKSKTFFHMFFFQQVYIRIYTYTHIYTIYIILEKRKNKEIKLKNKKQRCELRGGARLRGEKTRRPEFILPIIYQIKHTAVRTTVCECVYCNFSLLLQPS